MEDFVADDAIGAVISAQRNLLTLSCFGPRRPGCDVVFEKGARDNTVVALSLPNGVTNRAEVPSNRILCNWPAGFSVETPEVPPSGRSSVNRSSLPVQVLIVEPGEVRSWTIADCGSTAPLAPFNLSLADIHGARLAEPGPEREAGSQTIAGPLYAGQTIQLEPGDAVSFDYDAPPVWRWKG